MLSKKEKKVAIQIGPAVTVSLAEEFNLKAGKDLNGILFAILRAIGFDYVFDTSFAADLNILETAAELRKRMESKSNLPLISSCCPAWIKFAEQFYPEMLPLISTTNSPQQMMGALIKTHFAALHGLAPNQLYSLAAMPCVAKKFEAQRPEMSIRGQSEVDLVLSTRELAKLIRLYGIDINSIEPQVPDSPFSVRSTSGKLFANSGGTAEGVLRTLHYQVTGKEIATNKINDIRAVNGIKEYTQKIGKENLKVIVVNGISDIHNLMSSIASGETKADYIEVMTCPGGCINGGGQPMSDSKDVKARSKAIHEIDENESLKCAHNNPMIKELYTNFLESPGSEKAQKLLHVSFTKRDVLL